ncbi:MAG: type II toxin-antitoxin system mRNA interferase toxin, RelE/StbE family [Candidatus Nomurabacteria bacterium]|nr:type II toxin-antitoxin system mRNA interferase toxin, RelE/StbE family [Candidatus Nomurabacteria bacterium]
MYHRYYTKQFQKSFNKILSSGKVKRIDVEAVVDILCKGNKLQEKYQNHKLHGEYDGYDECHIKGDLIIIYKIEEEKLILILVDLGSHSELF